MRQFVGFGGNPLFSATTLSYCGFLGLRQSFTRVDLPTDDQ